MAARSSNDPVKAAARKSRARRRVGDRACSCGEERPEALIADRTPPICYECDEKQRGKSGVERHHVAGRQNSRIVIAIPGNDHRELSAEQYDYLIDNPDGSPIIAAANCVRSFAEIAGYLIAQLLMWIADLLATLEPYLTEKLGLKWWIGTPLEQWAPAQ